MAQEENLTPEELAAEQEATKDIKEEEVRAHVIEEFGFDETTDGEKIEKAFNKEMKNRKLLSTAIGQKIKLREKLKTAAPANPNPDPKPEPKVEGQQMSPKDIIALNKANVHEDDIEEIQNYASYKKISVADALKDKILQSILSDKQAERTTAGATHTGPSRRGSSQPTEDQILADASANKLPEDDAGIARLMAAKAPKPKSR